LFDLSMVGVGWSYPPVLADDVSNGTSDDATADAEPSSDAGASSAD